MKVICTCDQWKKTGDSSYENFPEKDNIYTVIESRVLNGLVGYQFSEIHTFIISNGRKRSVYWDASKFVPLNSYKEKELNEELAEIFN